MSRSTANRVGDPAARPRYLGGAAIAKRRGISHDLFTHRMRRHPAGLPEPDAWQELANGTLVPLWRPGRDAEFEAWEATFPGRTGRPRKQSA
jgi:hypothetical protein